jgi:hypothetical protein
MRNYGFEYLVEKAQLVTEMARSNIWSDYASSEGGGWSTWKDIYHTTLENIQKIGKVSVVHARQKTIEYLGMAILETMNSNQGFNEYKKSVTFEEIPPDERVDAKRLRFTPAYAGWLQEKGYKHSDEKAKEFSLINLVKTNMDTITAPAFGELVRDPEQISAYLNDRLTPSTSSFAVGRQDQIIRSAGVDREQLNELLYQVKPILNKLKKSGKMPKSIRMSDDGSSSEGELNTEDPMYPLETLVETLINLVDERNQALKMYKNGQEISEEEETLLLIPNNTLEQFVKVFQTRLKDKKPISKENIYSKFIQNLTTTTKVDGLEDLISDEFEMNLSEGGTESPIDAMVQRVSHQLDKFNPHILDQLVADNVISDDERQVVDQWKTVSSSIPKRAKRVKENPEEIAAQKSDLQALRDYETNKRKEGFEKKKRGGTRKLQEEEQITESSIMSYFSEQVEKDRHTHQHGVFVERGYRKPINYAHWLEINRE